MYGPQSGIVNFCNPCWWSDRWNPFDYGCEYDFSRPFFEQFKALMHAVPHQNLSVVYSTLVNSNYSNMNHQLKDCYWLFNSDYDERCFYGEEVENSKDCVDVTMVDGSELMHNSVNCVKCYRIFSSIDCEGCTDVWFSRNMSNCNDCFCCINLRGKKYHIFNKPYDKEEYKKEVQNILSGSYAAHRGLWDKTVEFWSKFPRKFMHGTQNVNVSGDYITHSKNVRSSYIVTGAENCKYCMWLIVKPNRDSYDATQFGENMQSAYQVMSCGNGIHNLMCGIFTAFDVRDSAYTIACWNGSSSLFGCVGLKDSQYCILNKQYTKEAYGQLLPKIVEHMRAMPYVDKRGQAHVYGDFFPPEISPFGYNETTANEYFPLSKEKAIDEGFVWKERERRDYKIAIQPENLPDRIEDAQDSLANEIVGCEHHGQCTEQCTTAFKIIPQELEFYRKMNLPLPRLCPNCRHYARLRQRNPLKLWKRRCMCNGETSQTAQTSQTYRNTATHRHGQSSCTEEFETSYSPDRAEIVYCENCYNNEVA